MGRSSQKSDGHDGPSMERWLLTYADLITLLMAFFVIMYAMSNVDASKYSAMAQSLKIALGVEDRSPGLISTMMTGQKPGNDKTLSLKDKNKDKATADERRFIFRDERGYRRISVINPRLSLSLSAFICVPKFL